LPIALHCVGQECGIGVTLWGERRLACSCTVACVDGWMGTPSSILLPSAPAHLCKWLLISRLMRRHLHGSACILLPSRASTWRARAVLRQRRPSPGHESPTRGFRSFGGHLPLTTNKSRGGTCFSKNRRGKIACPRRLVREGVHVGASPPRGRTSRLWSLSAE